MADDRYGPRSSAPESRSDAPLRYSTVMAEVDQQRKRAWELAHKILSLIQVVPTREGKDLLQISTQEICRAMGQPEGAKLEEVKDFVFQVLGFLQGYDVHLVCGCGYLSLLASAEDWSERFLEHGREPTPFSPPDLEQYFYEHVINGPRALRTDVPQICESEAESNR